MSKLPKTQILLFLLILNTLYFILFSFVSAQQPPIIIPPPPTSGQGLTLANIASIIAIIGSFLTSIGVLLAIIAIIVSGIMYMKAGGDSVKAAAALTWFKNALIGALIILGVGVIINTIANVVSRDFFCRLMFFGRCIW